MRGDSWHREPPWRIRGVAEAAAEESWDWALHDCWIDIERVSWERSGSERRISSVRFPVALDPEERERELWEWELIIRNPRRLRIDDRALIAVYSINAIEASANQIIIRCNDPLTVEIEVDDLDIAVEARAKA